MNVLTFKIKASESETYLWAKYQIVAIRSERTYWIAHTSLSQMFASLGLCERRHLIELGVDARVFEAIEVDTFAVNHTV